MFLAALISEKIAQNDLVIFEEGRPSHKDIIMIWVTVLLLVRGNRLKRIVVVKIWLITYFQICNNLVFIF